MAQQENRLFDAVHAHWVVLAGWASKHFDSQELSAKALLAVDAAHELQRNRLEEVWRVVGNLTDSDKASLAVRDKLTLALIFLTHGFDHDITYEDEQGEMKANFSQLFDQFLIDSTNQSSGGSVDDRITAVLAEFFGAFDAYSIDPIVEGMYRSSRMLADRFLGGWGLEPALTELQTRYPTSERYDWGIAMGFLRCLEGGLEPGTLHSYSANRGSYWLGLPRVTVDPGVQRRVSEYWITRELRQQVPEQGVADVEAVSWLLRKSMVDRWMRGAGMGGARFHYFKTPFNMSEDDLRMLHIFDLPQDVLVRCSLRNVVESEKLLGKFLVEGVTTGVGYVRIPGEEFFITG